MEILDRYSRNEFLRTDKVSRGAMVSLFYGPFYARMAWMMLLVDPEGARFQASKLECFIFAIMPGTKAPMQQQLALLTQNVQRCKATPVFIEKGSSNKKEDLRRDTVLGC